MPSVFDTRGLPTLGLPVSDWGTKQPGIGVTRNTRREKLGLWSAVALQQHFTSTGDRGGLPLPPSSSVPHVHEGGGGAVALSETTGSSTDGVSSDLRSYLGPAPGLAGRPHKPTLAQRMGLVPGPPPAPSADEWRVVVHRALLREQQHTLDAGSPGADVPVCSICQMGYAVTGSEGQVILSCSHVFHAQCFRSFERYVRAQQRADAVGFAEVAAPLACPVCRTRNYHKRIFYEGKALAQRAAIVKVQAAARGLLARRAYTKMRLKSNPEFRARYVHERLARLSAAWKTFCDQQEQKRAAVQAALVVQRQTARAAYLSEEAWAELWRKAVQVPSASSEPGPSAASCIAAASVQCPICLELIQCTHCPGTSTATFHTGEERNVTGVDAVAAMRMAYEARQAAKRSAKDESRVAGESSGMLVGTLGKGAAKHTTGNPSTIQPRASSLLRGGKRMARRAPQHRAGRQKASAPSATATPLLEHNTPLSALVCAQVGSADEVASVHPHRGVLLSCGHYFHAACIDCYERFNDRNSLEKDDEAGQAFAILMNRCPICRSGYAKHSM
ncbi:hypothetical protein LSCM4_01433 [Leishmania orientalis]|uniref:RING-type domain-containing protein n=1 Tax=Leishmania orientalis TaxID=2249476 RepID=A0A836FNY7_9TRYP|nr:hypothetical protein LSCM4_01433 [Leishmania orientalis]